MNDFLKFRVWDIKNQGYIHDDADYCFIASYGTVVIGYYGDGEQHDTEYSYAPDEVIVERCTGLKDTTRKLIYEGDITVQPLGINRGVVVWEKKYAAFYKKVGKISSPLWSCKQKIIGNIHDEVKK